MGNLWSRPIFFTQSWILHGDSNTRVRFISDWIAPLHISTVCIVRVLLFGCDAHTELEMFPFYLFLFIFKMGHAAWVGKNKQNCWFCFAVYVHSVCKSFIGYCLRWIRITLNKGIFMCCIQHCFIYRPSDSTVSEDAGIEPRTVAASALAVRRSKYLIVIEECSWSLST